MAGALVLDVNDPLAFRMDPTIASLLPNMVSERMFMFVLYICKCIYIYICIHIISNKHM